MRPHLPLEGTGECTVALRLFLSLYSDILKMGNSLKNQDYRNMPIPADRLWKALRATLDVFGPSMKEATILELQKNGLDPEKNDQQHTLAEIGEKLSSIFGADGTEVILEQIARQLRVQE